MINRPEEVGDAVRSAIDGGAPYVHVEGLPFIDMAPADLEMYITSLSGAIGRMTLTAGVPDSTIWKLDKTTSPSTQYIPYHTDNPFLAVPEKVVGFWSVKSSSQGGENLILPVDDLLEWASAKPEYTAVLQEIDETSVTFELGSEKAAGKILDFANGSVRFDMKYIGKTAKHLGGLFRSMLSDSDVPAQTVKLSEGGVLFFDNEKTLHARNEYNDLSRISLRVRMAS